MENQTLENIDFNEIELDEEYYNCVFISCDFSKKMLDRSSFDSCEFRQCDFSLVKFIDTLHEVRFVECKVIGADFTNLNKFSNSLVFEQTLLNYANFVSIKIKNTQFTKCSLQEAYFDSSDISGSVFDDCDLLRASFNQTNLERVDFSSSYNFSINPNVNRLKKTIFPESGLRGLVAHLDIVINATT